LFDVDWRRSWPRGRRARADDVPVHVLAPNGALTFGMVPEEDAAARPYADYGTVLFATPLSSAHRSALRSHQWPFLLVMACNLVVAAVLCAPLLSAAAAGRNSLAGRSLAAGSGSGGDARGYDGGAEYVPALAATLCHLAAAFGVGLLGVVATWRLSALMLHV
jgi:hypothetical protein